MSATLNSAVSDFVLSLSVTRREELASLFINSHVSWPWYEEVIDRFNLRDPASPVVSDIEAQFSDETIFRFMESDFDGPVFEAGIILREAKEFVLENSVKGIIDNGPLS